MELIFPFRNNFSCPGLVWKLLTLGKKGMAAQQGLCCVFIRGYRVWGLCPASPKPATGESASEVSNGPSFRILALQDTDAGAGIPFESQDEMLCIA